MKIIPRPYIVNQSYVELGRCSVLAVSGVARGLILGCCLRFNLIPTSYSQISLGKESLLGERNGSILQPLAKFKETCSLWLFFLVLDT